MGATADVILGAAIGASVAVLASRVVDRALPKAIRANPRRRNGTRSRTQARANPSLLKKLLRPKRKIVFKQTKSQARLRDRANKLEIKLAEAHGTKAFNRIQSQLDRLYDQILIRHK